jgi:hypothetical protein
MARQCRAPRVSEIILANGLCSASVGSHLGESCWDLQSVPYADSASHVWSDSPWVRASGGRLRSSFDGNAEEWSRRPQVPDVGKASSSKIEQVTKDRHDSRTGLPQRSLESASSRGRSRPRRALRSPRCRRAHVLREAWRSPGCSRYRSRSWSRSSSSRSRLCS